MFVRSTRLVPQARQGSGEQTISKRQHLVTIIENHADPKAISRNLGNLSQSLKVCRGHGCGGLHLDSNNGARIILKNDIDLDLILVAIVMQC